MNPFATPNGLLSSGFFIFIIGGQDLSDEDVLTRFGYSSDMSMLDRSALLELDHRQTRDLMGGDCRYVVFADTERWKLVADDRFYTLWTRSSMKPTILELAAEGYDILTFATGSMDSSYDLRYFRDGDLVREWIVDDVHNGPDQGQQLRVNFGHPLPGERGIQNRSLKKYLLEVAAANGLDVAESIESARLWCGEEWIPAERSVNDPTGSWRPSSGTNGAR